MITRTLLVLLLAAGTPATAARQSQSAALEPYLLTTDQGAIQAQIGRIAVPERRGGAGRTIKIAFVRIPSTSPTPGSPIIYLDGGPGGSGIAAARVPAYAALFRELRAHADVILLSQRGTGLSDRVGCLGGGPMPDDTLIDHARMVAVFTARHRTCADSLRARGADLAGYTTQESADDVDAVRAALGAPRMSLIGFSYGTHLALSVIRRHGERVDRVTLLGVEGPGHTWKLPGVYDRQVAAIGERVASDPRTRAAMPDFAAALRRLIEATRKQPIQVTATIAGKPRTLTVGADGILMLLRRDIGDTNDFPWIPAFVYDTLAGDTAPLQRLLERRLPGYESGINMMAVGMDCASAASAARLAEIRKTEDGSTFGPITNFPFPDVCAAAGIAPLDDAFRAPVTTLVPALFVSGTFDSNTPPAQADEILAGFANGSHVIVDDAGHESTLIPAVRGRIVSHMRGETVRSARVRGATIVFDLPKATGSGPGGAWQLPSGLDGQITVDERTGADTLKMSRGGVAYLRRAGDMLYVAIESPAGGFAHVCVGHERKIRVLHASAALGDAEFEARGDTWARLTNFSWALRDSTRVPPPTAEQKQAHLESRGWLGMARNGLTRVREFLIRLRPDDRYAAVAFAELEGPIQIAIGPAAVMDGCASGPVAQGPLPESAAFAPRTWFPLDRLR